MSDRNDFNPHLGEPARVGPCIGMLELCSVARGVLAADAVLWEAEVEMLFSTPVQPGKYVLLFTGSVQDVGASLTRGKEEAGDSLVDELLIEQVHEQVPLALSRKGGQLDGELDAIGIVETSTVASAILAADQALKTATVDLFDLRIANGLGGKSFLSLIGEVSDVRSSVAAGAQVAADRGQLTHEVVIPRPHRDLARHL